MNTRPSKPATSFALEALARSGNELAIAAQRVGETGADPIDAVHELRVAIRRLRADLRIFARVLDPVWFQATQKQLRDIGCSVGEVRDLDVVGIRLEHVAELLPESERWRRRRY